MFPVALCWGLCIWRRSHLSRCLWTGLRKKAFHQSSQPEILGDLSILFYGYVYSYPLIPPWEGSFSIVCLLSIAKSCDKCSEPLTPFQRGIPWNTRVLGARSTSLPSPWRRSFRIICLLPTPQSHAYCRESPAPFFGAVHPDARTIGASSTTLLPSQRSSCVPSLNPVWLRKLLRSSSCLQGHAHAICGGTHTGRHTSAKVQGKSSVLVPVALSVEVWRGMVAGICGVLAVGEKGELTRAVNVGWLAVGVCTWMGWLAVFRLVIVITHQLPLFFVFSFPQTSSHVDSLSKLGATRQKLASQACPKRFGMPIAHFVPSLSCRRYHRWRQSFCSEIYQLRGG